MKMSLQVQKSSYAGPSDDDKQKNSVPHQIKRIP